MMSSIKSRRVSFATRTEILDITSYNHLSGASTSSLETPSESVRCPHRPSRSTNSNQPPTLPVNDHIPVSNGAQSIYITKKFHPFGFVEVGGMVRRNLRIANARNVEVRVLVDVPVRRSPTGTGESAKAAEFMLDPSGLQSLTLILDPLSTVEIPIYLRPLSHARYFKPLRICIAHPKEKYEVYLTGYGGRCHLSVLQTQGIRCSDYNYYVLNWDFFHDQALRFTVNNDGWRPAYCTVSLKIHENHEATSETVGYDVVPAPQVVVNRNSMQTFIVNFPDLDGLFARIGRGQLGDGESERGTNSAATAKGSSDRGLLITITWGEEIQRRRAKEVAVYSPALSQAMLIDCGPLSYSSPFLNEDPQWKVPTVYPVDKSDMKLFLSNLETIEIFVRLPN